MFKFIKALKSNFAKISWGLFLITIPLFTFADGVNKASNLSDVAHNISYSVSSFQIVVLACAAFAGVFLVILGLFLIYLKTRPEHKHKIAVWQIAGSIIVGVLLLCVFTFIQLTSHSLTGQGVDAQTTQIAQGSMYNTDS